MNRHRSTQHRSPNVGLWLLATGLAFGTWYQTDSLRRVRRGGESAQGQLESQMAGMRIELEGLRGEMSSVATERTRTLAERLQDAESRISEFDATVEAQAEDLAELQEVQANFGPDSLREVLDTREAQLVSRWESLGHRVEDVHQLAEQSNNRVQELAGPPDLDQMWHELVGPVVQLAGDASVGSGVLLESHLDQESGRYRTYLMTAWHVVRDIQGDLSRRDMPVPVAIYAPDGTITDRTAALLEFNAKLDAALLEVMTDEPLRSGARLASRERLGEIRIFDTIFAVGCPLGNDPIPTRGEISTNRHQVDGEAYWMINAPTYIGNSGGGIFDGRSHELLGIFSKIYTHGSLRPTIVPHMGLATPMNVIYDWLETTAHAHVVPGSELAREASARGPQK